jgi:hypothetical protein
MKGLLFGLLAVTGMTACGGGGSSGTQPAPAATQSTMLEVVNHSSSDMDIFMSRMGDRVRLGLAPANVTTKFELLPAQVAGVGSVQFQARPILGGFGRPAESEPTPLRPGDTITLEIPPP